MATYVKQRQGGESATSNPKDSNKDKHEDEYDVWSDTETLDIYAARAAVESEVPFATSNGLVVDSIKVQHREAGIWDARVSYVAPEKQKKKNPDIGEIEWEFDDQGGTQHITQGLAPTTIYAVPGWNPLEFQRAIDVSRKKTGWEVKGTDIVVPKGLVQATTSFNPNDVNADFRKKLKKLIGRTNDKAWKDWEKGELKYLGHRIKEKARDKTTVTFSMLEAANITAADNVKLGGDAAGNGAAGPIEMTGHQFIWSYFVQEEDNNQVLMKLKQVQIETVCLEGDFGDLGLGN